MATKGKDDLPEVAMSVWDAVFKPAVIAKVMNDPRTDRPKGLRLGYEWSYIVENIIKKGLADFSKDYDPGDEEVGPVLTAGEVALLYCFGNVKGHFLTAQTAMELCKSDFTDFFDAEGSKVVIDVGCGPGTGLLALVDLFPGQTIRYYGIDSAAPMRRLASQLSRSLKAEGFISEESERSFLKSWTELRVGSWGTRANVLIIFSYFFASQSLDKKACKSLIKFVNRISTHAKVKTCLLLYMNSAYEIANQSYLAWFRPKYLDGRTKPDDLADKCAVYELIDVSE